MEITIKDGIKDGMNIFERAVKRVFDFVCSFLALIILFPVFIIVSIAILCQRDGSVFFRQERIGYKGKPFLPGRVRRRCRHGMQELIYGTFRNTAVFGDCTGPGSPHTEILFSVEKGAVNFRQFVTIFVMQQSCIAKFLHNSQINTCRVT